MLVGDAVAGNGGIAPPDSATNSGSAINDLYWIVIGITLAIFLLVEGALVWFILRFRHRGDDDTEGPQIHGNTRLELLWTAVPFLILVAILIVTIVKIPAVQAKPRPGRPGHSSCRSSRTRTTGSTSTRTASSPSITLRLPVGQPMQL